jgi:hypothetical protein
MGKKNFNLKNFLFLSFLLYRKTLIYLFFGNLLTCIEITEKLLTFLWT